MVAVTLLFAGCDSDSSKNCRNCCIQEVNLWYARQENERLERDLAQVSEKLMEMLRAQRRAEEPKWIGPCGARLVMRKNIEGVVLGIGPDTLVNVGSDQGLLEGDEFTVFRGQEFVAKLALTRVGRQSSTAIVLFSKTDPLPGDSVTSEILISPAAGKGH